MRRWGPKPWWTRRYVSDRTRQIIEQRRHPTEPWLCRRAVLILDHWLRPGDEMAEFGSGRSTRWFAERVGHLTSVEDDPAWHARVTQTLEGLAVDYRLCRDEASYVGWREVSLRRLSTPPWSTVLGATSARTPCSPPCDLVASW